MFLLAVLTLVSADHDPKPACARDTTLEVERCLGQELTQEDDQRARYYAAALKRLRDGHEPDVASELAGSERQWLAYRHAECGAVFDNWASGTIRVAKELQCETDLTRARTLAIWKNWLTYADNTPPILPRPPVTVLTDAL